MPSRQTIKNWQRDAVDFLTDLDWQVEIPGFEGEEIRQSKLKRDEALEMLYHLCAALGMEWSEFLEPLARAWWPRRYQKGKALGWDNEDDNEISKCNLAEKRTTKKYYHLPMPPFRTPGGCKGSHCPRCGATAKRPEGLCIRCYKTMGKRILGAN